MSLSKTVSDSLEAAEGQLRNALAFAARQERPVTCAAVADLLQRLENVKSVDDMIDKIENHFSE
jgi:chromosomal replication initiation ATPase DnaA